MKITKGEMIVVGIALTALLISACFYPYLPQRMASHWNGRGEVDGYMSKAWGTFLTPLVIAGVGLLFIVIVRIDPLRANIEKFRKYYDGFIVLFSVFMLCVHVWMLLWNLGHEISPNIVIPIGVGLLIFYSGILCENVKRNWFIGIRTPWTLSNDIVWAKTHRVGGKLFKVAGLIVFVGVFFQDYVIWFILVPVIGVAIFVLVYSYFVYRDVSRSGDTTGLGGKFETEPTTPNKTWETVKAGYLGQVKKALFSVGHREKKQVLEDVQSHLDQRFSELGADEQTWEDFQQIITEMGPAEDYAELLEPEPLQPAKKSRKLLIYFIIADAIILLLALGFIFLPNVFDKTIKKCPVRIESVIGGPFVNDPEVIGYWKSVDFVEVVEDFVPETKAWKGDLFLKDFTFKPNGRTSLPWTWTRDWIWHNNGRTKAQYKIKKIDGRTYLFLPWLSGDVTIRGRKPSYYVLKKLAGEELIITGTDMDEGGQVEKEIGKSRPVVIGTTPMAFANDVSPDLKEITVTFDQPMMNLSWSWVGGGETFPDMMGQPRYNNNKRMCTLPVKLEAGRFYWVGINSPQHKNFQTDMQVAAEPYVILFATRDENGGPTDIPDNFLEEARSINSAHGRPAAVDSAIHWLRLIDNGNYGTSWEEAAEVFKKAATKQQWESMAEMVREPLGKVISRQVMSKMPTQTVPGGPDAEYVIIQFKTSFEKKKDSIETVTPMLDEDGVWRVSGYYIR